MCSGPFSSCSESAAKELSLFFKIYKKNDEMASNAGSSSAVPPVFELLSNCMHGITNTVSCQRYLMFTVCGHGSN